MDNNIKINYGYNLIDSIVNNTENYSQDVKKITTQINTLIEKGEGKKANEIGIEFMKCLEQMPKKNFATLTERILQDLNQRQNNDSFLPDCSICNLIKILDNANIFNDAKSEQKEQKEQKSDRFKILIKLSESTTISPTKKFSKISSESPLELAAQRGDAELLKSLLDEGLRPNDSNQSIPLIHLAVKSGNVETVKVLLANKDIDPNQLNSEGITVVQDSLVKGNTAVLEALLADDRLDPNFKMPSGETALMYAVLKGQKEIVSILLNQNRIKPNELNSKGLSALITAVVKGNTDIIEAFLSNNQVDPDLQNPHGLTALMAAVQSNNEKAVTTLLKNEKVDPNRKMDKGITALMIAARNGNLSIINTLLSHNERVDPGLKDSLGQSALSYAVTWKKSDAVKALLPFYTTQNEQTNEKDSLWLMLKKAGYLSAAKEVKNKGGKDRIDWSKIMITQLSHQLSLIGTVEVEFEGQKIPINFEGSTAELWLNKMAKSINKFQGLPSHQQKKLSEMLQLASNTEECTPEKYLKSFRAGNPITISTGFTNHSVQILLTPPTNNNPAYLYLCNRGAAMVAPIEVFAFDEKHLTVDIIKKISEQRKASEEHYAPFREILMVLLDSEKDALSQKLESEFNKLPEQTAGNCTWVSAETTVLAAMVALELESNPYSEDHVKKVIGKFEQWTHKIRIDTIESYLMGTLLNKKGTTINHEIAIQLFSELWKLDIKDKSLLKRLNVMEALYLQNISPSQRKLLVERKAAFKPIGFIESFFSLNK